MPVIDVQPGSRAQPARRPINKGAMFDPSLRPRMRPASRTCWANFKLSSLNFAGRATRRRCPDAAADFGGPVPPRDTSLQLDSAARRFHAPTCATRVVPTPTRNGLGTGGAGRPDGLRTLNQVLATARPVTVVGFNSPLPAAPRTAAPGPPRAARLTSAAAAGVSTRSEEIRRPETLPA